MGLARLHQALVAMAGVPLSILTGQAGSPELDFQEAVRLVAQEVKEAVIFRAPLAEGRPAAMDHHGGKAQEALGHQEEAGLHRGAHQAEVQPFHKAQAGPAVQAAGAHQVHHQVQAIRAVARMLTSPEAGAPLCPPTGGGSLTKPTGS